MIIECPLKAPRNVITKMKIQSLSKTATVGLLKSLNKTATVGLLHLLKKMARVELLQSFFRRSCKNTISALSFWRSHELTPININIHLMDFYLASAQIVPSIK